MPWQASLTNPRALALNPDPLLSRAPGSSWWQPHSSSQPGSLLMEGGWSGVLSHGLQEEHGGCGAGPHSLAPPLQAAGVMLAEHWGRAVS